MAPLLEIRVTESTGTEYLSNTVETLAAAFSTDPVVHYFLNCSGSRSYESSLRHRLFTLVFTAASLSRGTFYEGSTTVPEPGELRQEGEPGFHCAAIVMPPGRAVDSPGFFGWLQIARTGLISLVWDIGLSRFYRILVAFPSIPEGAKHATFAPGELYYYVVMIATDEKFRGKGLCAKVLERVKDQAQRDGKPVWLEATTRGSRKVYQKVGFEDVFTDETEEGGGLLIGKGVCDEEGDEGSGKEKVGFVIWPMVWWPQGYVKGVGMQS